MTLHILTLLLLFGLTAGSGYAQQTRYQKQWISISGDSRVERSNAIAVDEAGNSYVTGHSQLPGDESSRLMYLVKFDTNGVLLWEQSFDFGAGSDGQHLIIDHGYVVVATESQLEGKVRTTLSRHQIETGDLVSSVEILIGRNTTVYHFIIADEAHYFIVGRANRERDSNFFGFIAKIDTEGSVVWVREIGTDHYSIVREIAKDESGGLYVTGHSMSQAIFGMKNIGQNDTFVAKYDQDGNLIWGQRYGSQFQDYGISLSLTQDGHILAGGSGNGRFDKVDEFVSRIFYVVKLDQGNGSIIRTTYYNPGNDFFLRKIIATDANSFLFAGWTNGSFFNTIQFSGDVAVFGEVRNWRLVPESFQHIQSRFSYVHSMARHPNGSVYWTGFTIDGLFNNPQQNSSYNVFVVKMSPVLVANIDTSPWEIESGGHPLFGSWIFRIGVLISIVCGIYFTQRRRKTVPAVIRISDFVELMIVDSKLIAFHGSANRLEFDGREEQLARRLYLALVSKKVVLNDEVDLLLLPSHPSPDYVRKIRNVTLDRLETRLQSFCPLPEGATYIIRTVYASDRRKSQYQFNPTYVTLAESASRLFATA